jgi:hypothetical protein
MSNKLQKLIEANRPAHFDFLKKPETAGVSKLHGINNIPEVPIHSPLPSVKKEPIRDGKFKMSQARQDSFSKNQDIKTQDTFVNRAESFDNLYSPFQQEWNEEDSNLIEEDSAYVVFYNAQVLFESSSLDEALSEIQRIVLSEKATLQDLKLYKKLDLSFGVHVISFNNV